MTRIGELNRILTLQTRQSSPDAEGRDNEDWFPIGTIRANINPLTAKDFLLAGQGAEKVTHQITVRFRKDLATPPVAGGVPSGHDLRLTEGNRVFAIHSVIHDQERRRWLILLCVELESV